MLTFHCHRCGALVDRVASPYDRKRGRPATTRDPMTGEPHTCPPLEPPQQKECVCGKVVWLAYGLRYDDVPWDAAHLHICAAKQAYHQSGPISPPQPAQRPIAAKAEGKGGIGL